MKEITTILKEIVDAEGETFLESSPFMVYQELGRKGISDGKRRAVLNTLLAGISQKAKDGLSTVDLSKSIQANCYFRKNISDQLAEMYFALYKENKSEWEDQHEANFRKFCSTTWLYRWSGNASWHRNGGHINCYASASFELSVNDQELFRDQISTRLKSNPFTTTDWIYKHIQQVLNNKLNDDLKEYVEDDDDYYPPVMEDYWYTNQEDFEDYCCTMGFEVISFDGDADSDDFEPDHYGRSW